jgi:hypothetical protein
MSLKSESVRLNCELREKAREIAEQAASPPTQPKQVPATRGFKAWSAQHPAEDLEFEARKKAGAEAGRRHAEELAKDAKKILDEALNR